MVRLNRCQELFRIGGPLPETFGLMRFAQRALLNMRVVLSCWCFLFHKLDGVCKKKAYCPDRHRQIALTSRFFCETYMPFFCGYIILYVSIN